MESKKNDIVDDKLRWDLLPLDCLNEIARVYTKGANKYGENTWQYLDNGHERYKGALLRHLYEDSIGNDIDEDTGCMHLAQVAWNAIAMLWIKTHKDEYNKRVTRTRDRTVLEDNMDVQHKSGVCEPKLSEGTSGENSGKIK